MKRIAIYVCLGALLGAVLTTWLGPAFIGWWFKPPVSVPIDCTNAIQWSMHRLIVTQLGGIVVGLILGIIASFVFRKSEKI